MRKNIKVCLNCPHFHYTNKDLFLGYCDFDNHLTDAYENSCNESEFRDYLDDYSKEVKEK